MRQRCELRVALLTRERVDRGPVERGVVGSGRQDLQRELQAQGDRVLVPDQLVHDAGLALQRLQLVDAARQAQPGLGLTEADASVGQLRQRLGGLGEPERFVVSKRRPRVGPQQEADQIVLVLDRPGVRQRGLQVGGGESWGLQGLHDPDEERQHLSVSGFVGERREQVGRCLRRGPVDEHTDQHAVAWFQLEGGSQTAQSSHLVNAQQGEEQRPVRRLFLERTLQDLRGVSGVRAQGDTGDQGRVGGVGRELGFYERPERRAVELPEQAVQPRVRGIQLEPGQGELLRLLSEGLLFARLGEGHVELDARSDVAARIQGADDRVARGARQGGQRGRSGVQRRRGRLRSRGSRWGSLRDGRGGVQLGRDHGVERPHRSGRSWRRLGRRRKGLGCLGQEEARNEARWSNEGRRHHESPLGHATPPPAHFYTPMRIPGSVRL